MQFSDTERQNLLKTPFVGETVIARLEALGIYSFAQLKKANVADVTAAVAEMLGASCWKNSPQARRAIANAIETANREQF